MKNVDMQVKDGKLILTIDLSKQFGLSVSGKSRIISSARIVPFRTLKNRRVGIS